MKPKANRRREIIQIRAKINDKEKKTVEQISETGSWFFEKINEINIPLAKFITNIRERIQINKITNERGEITTNIAEIQTVIGECYEKLYTKKLDNLEEMDKFLET